VATVIVHCPNVLFPQHAPVGGHGLGMHVGTLGLYWPLMHPFPVTTVHAPLM
jgi:hypothetical protein